MRSFFFFATGAFAYRVTAQTATFDGMTWGPVTVGQVWPIKWTVGDGEPVDLILGNTSWNSAVFTAQAASPPEFNWTVTVPDGFVPGNYGLVLIQGDGMDYSPLFSISLAAGAATGSSTTSAPSSPPSTPAANATLTLPTVVEPTVTVTYWDHECGCTKTSAVPVATATNPAGTQYTWWDDSCGCTKTAMAPVPTGASGSNYTAPVPAAGTSIPSAGTGTNIPPAPPSSMATTAPTVPTSATAPYTGQANGQTSSSMAIVGILMAVAAAAAASLA